MKKRNKVTIPQLLFAEGKWWGGKKPNKNKRMLQNLRMKRPGKFMKSEEMSIETFEHQGAMLDAPYKKQNLGIEFFFMIAGYNAGKSFAVALQILSIAAEYDGHYIRVGIGCWTITFAQKTLLYQVFALLQQAGVDYEYAGGEHVLTIGTVQFVVLSLDQPQLIYGYHFNIFLGDELDELAQEKSKAAFVAIQERTRAPLPATKSLPARGAFSAFFTTAQGYRGTYQIIEEIKERGEPYWIIHAKSEDNKTTDRNWIARMRRIYTKIEAEVYLEGQFRNLTTGRVYYGYDEERDRLKEFPFAVESNDLVRVGQDFNSGYSCGTAIVKRNGILYVTKLWSFQEIGHAPKMIRTDFPPNQIEWYPDASGMEIVAGYAKEIKDYGIECRIGTINPSVIDRIFFVNHLFEAGLLKLFPNCGPLSMALKLRQFNDKGDPEKGKGPTAPDHRCDSLEYVVWRIVSRDQEYRDLWTSTREGRKTITDRKIV